MCECARCGEKRECDTIYLPAVDVTVKLCSGKDGCAEDAKDEGHWSEDQE